METHTGSGRFPNRRHIVTAFHAGRALHGASSLCCSGRNLEPAVKCIMGGRDKDPAQWLQVTRGQVRINKSGVLKTEFTELKRV